MTLYFVCFIIFVFKNIKHICGILQVQKHYLDPFLVLGPGRRIGGFQVGDIHKNAKQQKNIHPACGGHEAMYTEFMSKLFSPTQKKQDQKHYELQKAHADVNPIALSQAIKAAYSNNTVIDNTKQWGWLSAGEHFQPPGYRHPVAEKK